MILQTLAHQLVLRAAGLYALGHASLSIGLRRLALRVGRALRQKQLVH